MAYKNQRIDETSKPITQFFADRPKEFDSHDQDLIDKAERHYEQKLKNVDRWAEYRTDPAVSKLMDFVTWAKSRGGLSAFASMKDIHQSDMQTDNTDQNVPYWKRTYNFKGHDVTLEKKFIEGKIIQASHVCAANPGAYLDHKQNALFPRGKMGDKLISTMPLKLRRQYQDTIERAPKRKMDHTSGPFYVSDIQRMEDKQRDLLQVFKKICEAVRKDS